MSDAPDRLFAWPNGDGRLWYAADASDEITMCFDEVEYIRKDTYDAVIVSRDQLRAKLDDRLSLAERAVGAYEYGIDGY